MRRAVSLVFALSLVSCGSRSETKPNTNTPPAQDKKGFFAQVETPKVAPEVVKGEYANLPSTTSALLRFHDPWKWVSTGYAAAKKLAPAETEEFEKKATTEAGFNIFDLKAINDASGLDLGKPVSVFVDSALHVQTQRKDVFSGTASTAETFAIVIQGELSNKEKFTSNLQSIVSKHPTEKLVNADAGGTAIAYLYQPKSTYEEEQIIRAAIAVKDNTVKAIICPEGVSLTNEADFKKQVEAYISTPPAKTLAENEFFTQMTAHADPTGDLFLFLDVASIAVSVDGMLGSLAKGPEAEKAKEVITKLVASFPGMASSVSFSEKGMRGVGVTKLVAPKVEGMRSMLASKDAPAYGTIFPEGASYFIRSSLNLLGLKDYIMYLVPAEFKPQAESYIAMGNSAVGLYLPGFDIEKDILGAFSGNLAYSMDYTSMIAAPGSVPKFYMVNQLSSEAAGDKLLTAIAALPEKLGAPVKVTTEEVAGDKLYSIAAGPVEVAWGRCSDLLVIGTGVQSVKDMYARIKTPGASFADKTGSELAKNMVNAKTGSGSYIDISTVLMSLLASPEFSDPKAKEIIAKIAPTLGPVVSQSNYNPETQLDVSIMEMNFK